MQGQPHRATLRDRPQHGTLQQYAPQDMPRKVVPDQYVRVTQDPVLLDGADGADEADEWVVARQVLGTPDGLDFNDRGQESSQGGQGGSGLASHVSRSTVPSRDLPRPHDAGCSASRDSALAVALPAPMSRACLCGVM